MPSSSPLGAPRNVPAIVIESASAVVRSSKAQDAPSPDDPENKGAPEFAFVVTEPSEPAVKLQKPARSRENSLSSGLRVGSKGIPLPLLKPSALPPDLEISDKGLGNGAFGSVKVGKRKEELRAVKVINKTKTSAKRAAKEATALVRVASEHIVSFEGFYETANEYYIEMELAKGGNLAAHVGGKAYGNEKVNPLTEDAARPLMRQIAEGLALCHDNFIYHRDLKPENIVFADEAHTKVKIADFGLSKLSNRERTKPLGKAVGTSSFACPDLHSPSGYDGAKVDAWGLGQVIHVALTGRRAYGQGYIANAQLRLPVKLSTHAKDLLNKLLSPRAWERPNVKEALEHPWFKELAVGVPLIG